MVGGGSPGRAHHHPILCKQVSQLRTICALTPATPTDGGRPRWKRASRLRWLARFPGRTRRAVDAFDPARNRQVRGSSPWRRTTRTGPCGPVLGGSGDSRRRGHVGDLQAVPEPFAPAGLWTPGPRASAESRPSTPTQDELAKPVADQRLDDDLRWRLKHEAPKGTPSRPPPAATTLRANPRRRARCRRNIPTLVARFSRSSKPATNRSTGRCCQKAARHEPA